MLIRNLILAGRLSRTRRIRVQIERSRPRLYRIAYLWCQDYHVAQDLVQDTLEKSLNRVGQLKQEAALNVWLYRILNNSWRDYCRRQKDFDEYDGNTPSNDLGPEQIQINQQTAKAVRQAVGKLSSGFRQVVTLIDLEGCSYVETANILDVPVGTVMSRIARARKRLQESLSEQRPDFRQHSESKIRRIK